MDTAAVGYMAVGWELCFFKRDEPWTSIFLQTAVLLWKKPLHVQWDTKSKCDFFILELYCSVDPLWFLVLSLFNPSVCSISAVTLGVLREGFGESCWRGNVCFGRNMYFPNKFLSLILRLLNNYFLSHIPTHTPSTPCSIPAWIYFLWKRERNFPGLRILPWKLVHLQLGLNRLLWLFNTSFSGKFCPLQRWSCYCSLCHHPPL